jgi:hypothetical protein
VGVLKTARTDPPDECQPVMQQQVGAVRFIPASRHGSAGQASAPAVMQAGITGRLPVRCRNGTLAKALLAH